MSVVSLCRVVGETCTVICLGGVIVDLCLGLILPFEVKGNNCVGLFVSELT